MVETIDFKFGSLIRSGPQLIYGGKWDATLEDEVMNENNNAELVIHITIFFDKLEPAGGAAKGTHADADATATTPSLKKIQRWGKTEFEDYTHRLVGEAQRFWNGRFWLKTPDYYKGLNYPAKKSTHRCNIWCRFELEQVFAAVDAHYTIAVVRAEDTESFRSNSILYSQKDIDAEHMIPDSTVKFWTHYHEVGHLIGLGHVGHGKKRDVHADNSPQAYGVTKREMSDVMGKGHERHDWHATPWRQAAEAFTGIKASHWGVEQFRIRPVPVY